MTYFGILIAIIGFLISTLSGIVIYAILKERRHSEFTQHSLEAMSVANSSRR
jgi:hypothetical protein